MTRFTAPLAVLPDDVREYLHKVRSRGDDRTPGLYSKNPGGGALWAFLIGPAIAVVALWYASLSTKDAWAVALLQTAGVMLGGWVFVYAFRRWLNPNHFTYFDPLHVYQVEGETATVTSLADCRSVDVPKAVGVGAAVVSFDVGGPLLRVPVTGRNRAAVVEEYYAAVDRLETHDDDYWRSLPAGRLGAVAKHWIEYEELPKSPDQLNLDVPDVPADPRPTGRAKWAVGRYFLLLGLGGLVYLVFLQINDPIRDDRAYEKATAAGPGGLRGYLLDGRNTRHRPEAEGKLRALYEAAAARIEASAVDPTAKEGLLGLLKMLLDAPQPVASIRVTMESAGGPAGDDPTRRDLADALGTTVGKDLIAFVAAPEGEPAHVELVYRPSANNAAGASTVRWQLKLRPSLTDPPRETAERSFEYKQTGFGAGQTMTTAVLTAVYKDVFNTTPPYIPPPPPPDEDW